MKLFFFQIIINVTSKLFSENNLAIWTSNTSSVVSSSILKAVEKFTSLFSPANFIISNNNTVVNVKTTIYREFYTQIDIINTINSVRMQINVENGLDMNSTFSAIVFSNLHKILPIQQESDCKDCTVNSIVIISALKTNTSSKKPSISLKFSPINKSLFIKTSVCVYWNSNNSNYNFTSGWFKEGCTTVVSNNAVNCSCDHFTPFAVLMSSTNPDSETSDILTNVVLTISICTLAVSIVLLSVTMRRNAFMKRSSCLKLTILLHICIKLMCAHVLFLLASFLEGKLTQAMCIPITALMHFCYLAFFFWMLCEGGLISYQLTFPIHAKDYWRQFTIAAFCVGYGAPLLIMVITVSVAKTNYSNVKFCWLATENNVILSFVVPVVVILVVNLGTVAIVCVKKMRKSIGASRSRANRNMLRCFSVLVVILGLFWFLGAVDFFIPNRGLDVCFTVVNGCQGLCICYCNVLNDPDVQKMLKRNGFRKYSFFIPRIYIQRHR
ncbi:adhesion G protein-coupled receptor F5-like [Petromyzon marinus]|uniref:adhesion G protein-coupled receptor F5-like n=1 Tax=Petromyzon marinus TaxID=7757 RepID=UPI003F71C9F4